MGGRKGPKGYEASEKKGQLQHLLEDPFWRLSSVEGDRGA